MKPGFYQYIFSKQELGSVIALVYPSGVIEKLYIGNSELISKAILSDDWYVAENINIDNWEYIGL